MKILADEDVERPIVVRLRLEGYEVTSIAEIAAGSPDPVVLERANKEQALLLTADKDFGDLVFLHHYQAVGVVLMRLPEELSAAEKASIVVEVIKLHQERLLGSFTIITTRKVRITKLPPQSGPKLI